MGSKGKGRGSDKEGVCCKGKKEEKKGGRRGNDKGEKGRGDWGEVMRGVVLSWKV